MSFMDSNRYEGKNKRQTAKELQCTSQSNHVFFLIYLYVSRQTGVICSKGGIFGGIACHR